MTRAELKKLLGSYRPSLIPPEMLYETLSERKLIRLEAAAWIHYEQEKLAIYKRLSLTDEQRSTLCREASDRRWAAAEKLRPLQRLCDRMHERRFLKRMSPSTTRPGVSSRRRVAA
jgi:hypothetical protein